MGVRVSMDDSRLYICLQKGGGIRKNDNNASINCYNDHITHAMNLKAHDNIYDDSSDENHNDYL